MKQTTSLKPFVPLWRNCSITNGTHLMQLGHRPSRTGCIQSSDTLVFNLQNYMRLEDTSISVGVKNDWKIFVYPNPAENRVQIEVKGIDNNEKINLELYDLFGRKITSQEFISTGEINRYILNLNAETASGIYMLRFRNGNEQQLFKLIIQK